MTSGRHSRRREFTPVPSHDSIFVYKMPCRRGMALNLRQKSGAPNENIIQSHLNIALLNLF